MKKEELNPLQSLFDKVYKILDLGNRTDGNKIVRTGALLEPKSYI